MEALNYLFPFLNKLDNGAFIRKIIKTLLKFAGWVFLIGGVILSLVFLIQSFSSSSITIGSILAFLLVALVIISLGYTISQIHFYHAKNINELPDSPFTITPIIIQIIRMTGEILATFIISAGLISFILIVFMANSDSSVFYQFRIFFPSIISGPYAILISIALAFTCILIFYFISEIYNVLIDIAINVRLLNTTIANIKTQSAYTAVAIGKEQEEIVHKCPSCNADIHDTDLFCENCGLKLK